MSKNVIITGTSRGIGLELIKLFSNAWRYINFSIANQFYDICENFNINFNETKLEFNNELLNLAYLKSFKNITSFSFYSSRQKLPVDSPKLLRYFFDGDLPFLLETRPK